MAGMTLLFGCDLLTGPPKTGGLSLTVVREDAGRARTVDAARGPAIGEPRFHAAGPIDYSPACLARIALARASSFAEHSACSHPRGSNLAVIMW